MFGAKTPTPHSLARSSELVEFQGQLNWHFALIEVSRLGDFGCSYGTLVRLSMVLRSRVPRALSTPRVFVATSFSRPHLGRRVARLGAGVLVALGFSFPGVASADNETPGETERALPGLVRVGIPIAAVAPVVLAGSGGFALIDPVEDLDSGAARLAGRLAVAYSPIPQVSLGIDMMGRVDFFSSETNLYGEPRLTARLALPAGKKLHLGAELDARLIGQEAPSIALQATSPSLRGMLGAELSERTWLAAHLGFHLDRSERTVPDEVPLSSVSTADRITLGASSWSAVQWGVGVSHRLSGPKTELIGELSGEILVGTAAPSLFQSPWQLSLGARHPLGSSLSIQGTIDLGLSARPDPLPVDDLMPIHPRLGAIVSLVWRFGVKDEESQSNAAEEEPEEETKPEKVAPPIVAIKTSDITGTVVDEGGRPLSDVEIIMTRPDSEPVTERSYADGGFKFADIPDEGDVSIAFKTAGYDDGKLSFKTGQERNAEVVLYPAVPAGQVKGSVRDLKGDPIVATIVISPGKKEVKVNADGTFDLELAPGRYTVKFDHPDYSRQKRVIRVQDRGVVILNIALSK